MCFLGRLSFVPAARLEDRRGADRIADRESYESRAIPPHMIGMERTSPSGAATAGALALLALLLSIDRSGSVAQEGPVTDTPGGQRPPAQGEAEAPPVRDARAEKILDDMIRAHGGSEAIRGRETIFIRYQITNFSSPEPLVGTLTLWFKRPHQMRREVTYPQKKQVVIYDGERAWVDDGGGPEQLAPVASSIVKRGIEELDGPLQYKQGSLKYLNVARDPMGRMTQKLSWRHEGYARDLMVDATKYHLLVIGSFETPAGAISRMQVFDDYRPVDGILIPWRKEVILNNERYSETVVLEVRFNESLDETLFRPGDPDTASSGSRPAAAASPR